MSLIGTLRENLVWRSFSALKNILPDNVRIEQEHGALRLWVSHLTGIAPPPEKRILNALQQLRDNKRFFSILQARHICHGCLFLYDRQAPFLMEDSRNFPMLLQYVGRYHHRPRIFRRCFLGLVKAYFAYEPGIPNPAAGPWHNREAGWQNRKLLRRFLQKHKTAIHDPVFNPDWVKAIEKNPELFSENPCQAYAAAALKNDFTAFNDICERLQIGKDSWFARGLVYEQVDEIVEKPDTEFKQHVNASINLLSRHRWSINKGLAKIINRYADSEDTESNARLRDFSLTQWKNPWLAEQTRNWKPVSQEAKSMVSVWIKQHLIRQFFWMLAQGTPFDVRRAEFWMQYHRRIDPIYFALGSMASSNSSRDFIEIRRAMEGHLLGLHKAGRPDNNACIFIIGNHVIVEFGTNDIPAYIYDRRTPLPFELKRGFRIAGDNTGLRNSKAAAFVRKLAHRDTESGRWEEIFERELLKLGIRKPG